MKITILAIGSRGDVEPYIALGEGLKAAGHQVRLATHINFKNLIEGHGLEYFPLEGNPQEVLEKEAGQRWLETGARISPITFMRRMKEAAAGIMPRVADDAIEACRGADLIINHMLAGLIAVSIAEKFNIRVVPAYLQHVHPTGIYPTTSSVPKPALGSLYNRLTYPLAAQAYWQTMRRIINDWRVKSLGLRPYSLWGPFSRKISQKYRFLYAFSLMVVPRAPEWGENIAITGYWFLDKSSEWQPPPELVEFIESGEPPVFVGFSSMTDRNPEAITAIVVEALRMTGRRGIIGAGWSGIGDMKLPENVFRIDSVPFDWLFPRMAAVAHHGGAGTTATGLRAGVPSIILPFFADQFFWGWRVSELGAGPKAIPRQKLTSENLAAAIRQAVSDHKILRNAAELGERIRGEDGIGNALKIINTFQE